MTSGWFEAGGDPVGAEGWVTVARFESPVEAQMARGMLESAGIECSMTGENANNLLQAAFRVRLQVAAADEPAARELLRGADPANGYPRS